MTAMSAPSALSIAAGFIWRDDGDELRGEDT